MRALNLHTHAIGSLKRLRVRVVGLLRRTLALAVFNAHAGCIELKFGPNWLSPFMAVRSFYLSPASTWR